MTTDQLTTAVYELQQELSRISALVTDNSTKINTINTSIALINKISKLLDVNIQNPTKDDLLQYDGDRWTNIKPSKLGINTGEGSNMSLENLSDVSITNKLNGQALVWSNTDNKWINSTIETESGGGDTPSGGLDVTAMWEELGKNSANQIHPSHVTGTLTLSGLNVNGNTSLKSGTVQLTVNGSKVSLNGDLTGTGEITAYSI